MAQQSVEDTLKDYIVDMDLEPQPHDDTWSDIGAECYNIKNKTSSEVEEANENNFRRALALSMASFYELKEKERLLKMKKGEKMVVMLMGMDHVFYIFVYAYSHYIYFIYIKKVNNISIKESGTN